MLQLLRSMSPVKTSLVGVDISAMSVKLLELSYASDQYHVESYGVVPMTPDAFVDGGIKDVEAVGDAISRAKTRAGCDAKFAAAAVSSSSVITKVVTMDIDLSDMEMEQQVMVEASKFVPFPVHEVRLDFTILGPNREDETRIDVLVVACRSEKINLLSDSLEMAGFTPRVIDVEPYAVERTVGLFAKQLNLPDTDNCYIAVMDMGAAVSTLSVLQNLHTIYTREEDFGGKTLTEAIQQRYGLSYEEAGFAKKTGELSNEGHGFEEVLNLFKTTLLPHVRRSLQFFYSASNVHAVDALILAGGNACIPGIAEVVQEALNVTTTVANPFNSMTIASKVNPRLLHNDAPALVIASGLAMRGAT